MGCTTRIKTSDCFYNNWKMCRGAYWSLNGGQDGQYADVVMSRTSGSCPVSGITKRFYLNTPGTLDEFTVNVFHAYDKAADIEVWRTSELVPDEPDMTKPQIISNHSDKLGYNVGDIIKSECVVKNIGGAGIVYLKVGIGYIDSSNMIFLTGHPTTDQLFLNYQQFYTFKEDVKVDVTDYYRQQGIGWAYLQQQMYLFFLVGHRESTLGNIIWDAERHIKIYLSEPEGFTDPTSLPEVLPGELPDLGETIEGFGGLGGLKWVYDTVKPDTEDIINWGIDKITPEPKEEDAPIDIMPFLYIGFMGFIGYILIRSQ